MNNFRRYAAAAQQSVLQKLGNSPTAVIGAEITLLDTRLEQREKEHVELGRIASVNYGPGGDRVGSWSFIAEMGKYFLG